MNLPSSLRSLIYCLLQVRTSTVVTQARTRLFLPAELPFPYVSRDPVRRHWATDRRTIDADGGFRFDCECCGEGSNCSKTSRYILSSWDFVRPLRNLKGGAVDSDKVRQLFLKGSHCALAARIFHAKIIDLMGQ
jgi:hypothetical protein